MTVIDLFINRFRNKSVFLYTAVVVLATGYVFYLIDTVPEVPKEPRESKRTSESKKSPGRINELGEGKQETKG